MNVGIYIGNLSLSGIGLNTYTNALIKILASESVIKKIYIIHSSDQKNYIQDLATANDKIIPKEVDLENNLFLRLLINLSKILNINRTISNDRLPSWIDKISNLINPYYYYFNRLNVDLIHTPLQVFPVYKIKKPLIITIHDFQDLHFPEFFTPIHRIERAIHLYRAMLFSNQIVVSFKHIKDDIIKYFDIPRNKISIFPLPLSKHWVPIAAPIAKEELFQKFTLPSEYLFYPAKLWPHKNHLTLVESLKKLKEQGYIVNLVCTGEFDENFNNLSKKILEYGLTKQVKFLGSVSDAELLSLYHNSKLVVIPTLYEAGSGPLIEALWLGLPVICSNVTSLPETIGNERFTFDPLDSEKLAELILKMLNDEKFIEDNIRNSQQRREELAKIDINNILIKTYSELLLRWKEQH